jgi:deoxyadenosine/deoxycytidine kinase
MAEKRKLYVAIAGNIGTGKTTLTNALSGKFGWKPHFEFRLPAPPQPE